MWHSGKESVSQCRRLKTGGLSPWVWKIPWRRKWKPTPVFLPEKFHGQRSLVGYSPGGLKESDMTEQLNTHAHHSYIVVVWRGGTIMIPPYNKSNGVALCPLTSS